jgi:hypothetical protein
MPQLSRRPSSLLPDMHVPGTSTPKFLGEEALRGLPANLLDGPLQFCPLHRGKVAPTNSLVFQLEIAHCRNEGEVPQQISKHYGVDVAVRKFCCERMAQAVYVEVRYPKTLAPIIESELNSADR